MKRMLLIAALLLASCASNPPDYGNGKIPFDEQTIDAQLLPINADNIPERNISIGETKAPTFSLIPSRKSFELISDYRFVAYISGVMSIDAFALDGRLVSNIYSGPIEAGSYNIDFIEKRINPGVFVIRYRLDSHQQLFRTILLKE